MGKRKNKRKPKEDIVISVQNVSKTFKIPKERKSQLKQYFINPFHKPEYVKFDATNDISFDVKKGEFLGIIGRNGSGKSTMLKLLAGIYQPTKGTIKVNGKITPFLELGVGFNPELSARENIYLNGTILGMTRKHLEKIFNEIVDFAEIGEFIDMPVKNFSSGMQVRLAFAIAIQSDADVYLVDEVLAVGDANFQEKCFDVFRRFKKEGKTVVFVSHDLGSVELFCDRAVLLEKGAQILEGIPQKVIYKYSNKEFEAEAKSDENRWGSKEVEIEEVVFLDHENQQRKVFSTGEDVTISIKYTAKKKVKSPNFGVAIFDHNNNYCYGINTRIDLNSPKFIKGKGEVRLKYPRIKLLNGIYQIDVAVYGESESEIFDFHNKKYKFKITTDRKDQGMYYLEHEWNFNE